MTDAARFEAAPMSPTMFALTLAAVLGSALVAGVFFAFSTFVMDALDRTPPSHAIGTMNQINETVVRPGFMIAFVGTAILALVLGVHAVLTWGDRRATFLLVASVLYLVGCFILTMVHHVPLNDHLADVDPNGAAAASEWRHYFDHWVPWNHVRTVAPLASTALYAVALTF
jgi:uncharacterized membrane protein